MRTRRAHAVPILLVLALTACSSTRPSRDPTGERFPEVRGESLDGKAWRLPDDIAGRPTVLLVGYVQEAQFDIDRWILGYLQAGAKAPLYEIPTVEGLLPGLFAGRIDEGMRAGIPEEEWAAVITVYGDAERITRFTGTERPRNARVLLLDASGRVAWFHDRGYSAREMLALAQTLESLATAK